MREKASDCGCWTRNRKQTKTNTMKAINSLMIAAWVGIGLSACSGLRLSDTNALADDVYYDGSGGGVAATAPAVSTSVSASDVSSYERRAAQYAGSRTSTSYDSRDYSQIQQYYANAGSTNGAQDTSYVIPSTVKVTEVSSEYPDNGYWVDGFNGSESDQSYAERIIKFHRPLVSVNYYSPFFESARWSGDWNIYVDGYGSTYMVPTWSNPWYSDYYYGGLAYDWRWGRGWRFGLGWNWGSWNWGIGWSTGWGYYDWAYGGWGWPYHHHHHFGHPWGPRHGGFYGPRHDDKPHHDKNRDDKRYEPVRASRAVTTNQTYSGTRQRELTTNPRGEAAGQRYRQTYSGSERSYTRTTDGRATTTSSSRVSSSYGTNSRTRSDAAVGRSDNERSERASSAYRTNSRTSSNGAAVNNGNENAQRTSSAYQTNSRRTTTASEGNQTSRSTYTPNSRTTTRTQQAQQGVQSSQQNRGGSSYNTNTRRSSSSSTYTPSRSNNNNTRYNGGSGSRSSNRQSTTSSSSSRPRQSMSSQRSGSSSRSGSSFSGGSRSNGGGRSSGGARSGGRSR